MEVLCNMKNTVKTNTVKNSPEDSATTSTQPRPALSNVPVMLEPATIWSFWYHPGGLHEYMDSCECASGEDPCDCSCACDEEQMAQKAVSFAGSMIWTVKPLEERQRLLAKAARWN